MVEHRTIPRAKEDDLLRGLVAGLVSGLVGSVVIETFQSLARPLLSRLQDTSDQRKADPTTVRAAGAVS